MLLLYCLTEASAPATPPSTGVRGAAVESVEHSGLRCFYSAVGSIAAEPGSLKREALEFHAVTRRIFEQACTIPFRFPTTLASVAELDAYLGDHANRYQAALRDFRDKVQMELRIAPRDPPAPDAPTGAKYLRERAQRIRDLDTAITACRVAIHKEVVDWRQREFSHGVRCFVLVKREAVGEFQQKIKQVQLPEASTAAVSGPWPPTEFLPVFA